MFSSVQVTKRWDSAHCPSGQLDIGTHCRQAYSLSVATLSDGQWAYMELLPVYETRGWLHVAQTHQGWTEQQRCKKTLMAKAWLLKCLVETSLQPQLDSNGTGQVSTHLPHCQKPSQKQNKTA